jgi:hypothetical protein
MAFDLSPVPTTEGLLDPGLVSFHPSTKLSSVATKNVVKRRARSILTKEHAQVIFKFKPQCAIDGRVKAKELAGIYGVSVKTVRDIWNGRTWYRDTYELDKSNPIAPERLQKKPGRPKGARDFKPRTRKLHRCEPESQQNYESKFTMQTSGSGSASAALAKNAIAMLGMQFSGTTKKDVVLSRGSKEILLNTHCGYSPTSPSEQSLDRELPEFNDPFHDDWHFWPKENGSRIGVSGTETSDY